MLSAVWLGINFLTCLWSSSKALGVRSVPSSFTKLRFGYGLSLGFWNLTLRLGLADPILFFYPGWTFILIWIVRNLISLLLIKLNLQYLVWLLRFLQDSHSLRYLEFLLQNLLLDEVLNFLKCGQPCRSADKLVIVNHWFELVLLLLKITRHCRIQQILLVCGWIITVIIEDLLIVCVPLVAQGLYDLI
jgi:hypothetical protein